MDNALRRLRELRSLSQRELANRSGVDVSTINRLEKGIRKPWPRTLRKLAETLDIPVEELVPTDGENRVDAVFCDACSVELAQPDTIRALEHQLVGGTSTDKLAILLQDALSILQNQGHLQKSTNYSHLNHLTLREVDVLRLITVGSTNKGIANQLYISLHTVHSHVTNIISKLRVQSRTEAAIYAITHGLDS